MKKLILLLAISILSCSAPETVEDSKPSNGVITTPNYPPPTLHIPTWLQGRFYRTNALGGLPQTTTYRLYITDTEIRTEFDQTITSLFDPPVYNLIKQNYTSVLGNYYTKFQELYGTDIFGEYYRLYGDERYSNKKNVIIYDFWRKPSVANAMCWWYPNKEYWIKF